MLIGYARVSANEEDLSSQRDALERLGVDPDNIHVDDGLAGTSRSRPGLRTALSAVRADDTLVVAKLDRLARSLTDARLRAGFVPVTLLKRTMTNCDQRGLLPRNHAAN